MKCYVISICGGEYSDRWSKPVKVYLDQAKAQETMAKLEAIEKKFSIRQLPGEDWRTRAIREQAWQPLATAAYAELGFEATLDHDWCLEEAEIEQ